MKRLNRENLIISKDPFFGGTLFKIMRYATPTI